jgi:hypothetical protein
VYAAIAAIGVGVALAMESTLPEIKASYVDGARLVLCAGAAALFAAMAFIAWTTASLRDPGVLARAGMAAAAVLLWIVAAAVPLPPPVVAAVLLAMVAGLTAWEGRRARSSASAATG